MKGKVFSLLKCLRPFFGLTGIFFVACTPGLVFALSAIPSQTLSPSAAPSVILVSTTTTYIGGTFTTIGRNTNHFGVYSTSTASTTAQFPSLGTGNGQVVISDGAGGWYVGGFFTSADTYTRNYLVHVLSDGSVDPNFNPNLGGASTPSVYALALSVDRSILYVGGNFTTVNGGTTRNYFAAFNTSDGTVTSFNPNPDNLVYAITLSSDGAYLYLGGDFSFIGGQFRNGIASFTPSNGTVTSFNPNVTGESPIVYTLALSPDDRYLYFGGLLTTVGGTSRSNLAAVATSTGAVTSFNPALSDQPNSIAVSPDGATLYAGGYFTDVNSGTVRNRLAAFATSTGTVVAGFDPNVGNVVNSIALSPDGNTLYAGGFFTTVNGATTRNRLAAFSTSDGMATSFDPNLSGVVHGIGLSSSGGIAATGAFTRSNLVTRNRLAAFDNTTGELVNGFDPNMSGTVTALQLSPDGGTLYAGGTFNTVNGGTTRRQIAALSTSNGTVVSAFDAGMTVTGTIGALALSSDGSTIYAGGTFQTVNTNVTRNRLAAFSTANGTATSFDPNISNSVNALALSRENSTLYVGGSFNGANAVNGSVTRNRLAAFTTADSVVTAFNPDVSTVSSGVNALALSPDGGTLYLGGSFSGSNSVGNSARNYIAGVLTSDGSVTSFDPNLNGTVSVNGLALTSDGGTIYAGGAFTTVAGGGTSRSRLASFSTTDGAVTSFNPNLTATVNGVALSSDDSVLAAGGSISTNYFRSGYVSFNGPGTPTSLGGSSLVNGGTSSTTAPALSFSLAHASSTATVKYQIQVSTSSSFTTTAIDYTSALGAVGSKTFTVGQSAGSGTYTTGTANQTLSDGSYYWRVKTIDQTTDASGYKSANLGAIAFIVDTVAPVISSLSAAPGSSGATVTWTTDTAADSKVEYGADSSYGSATTLADASGVTSHSVAVSGLSSCTTYHYRVVTNDLAGNSATSSDATFTTTGCASSGGGGGGGGGGGPLISYVYGCMDKKASNYNANATYGINCSYASTSAATLWQAATSSPNALGMTYATTVPNAQFAVLQTVPTLPVGGKADSIRDLQIFLNAQGFLVAPSGPGSPGRETTVFGYATKAALMKFQLAKGILPATGYFGPKTRAFFATLSRAPVPAPAATTAATTANPSTFYRDLQMGITGPDVTALQEFLIAQKTGPAALSLQLAGTSPYFGARTKEALAEFQAKNKIIPASGYFGAKTRRVVGPSL